MNEINIPEKKKKSPVKGVIGVICMFAALMSVTIILTGCFAVFSYKSRTYEEIFKSNWGIYLPKGANILYEMSIPDFKGEGIRVAVLMYGGQSEPAHYDDTNKDGKVTDKKILTTGEEIVLSNHSDADVSLQSFLTVFYPEKNELFEELCSKAISVAGYDVPENYMPDFDEEYTWKHYGKHPWYGDPAGAHPGELLSFHDNLYMLFFPDAGKLIIVQDFK